MSKIQVNEIVNHFDNGAPDCPRGLTVTGVSTFSGNVSIGGTLTYEDVTNIDSVGIITAQSGIRVTTGGVRSNDDSDNYQVFAANGFTRGVVQVAPDGNGLDIKSTFNNSGYISASTISGGALYERLRIDSSGRVLIGTETARTNFYGSLSSNLQVQGSGFAAHSVYATNGNGAYILGRANALNGSSIGNISWQINDGSTMVPGANINCIVDGTPGTGDCPTRLEFSTRTAGASTQTQRMWMWSGGDITVGTSSRNWFSQSQQFAVRASTATGCAILALQDTGGEYPYEAWNAGNSGTRGLIKFRAGGAGNVIGAITSDGSTTTYSTTSDYRLKENSINITDGITRLKQLQPKRFNFIADSNKTVDGFIAHEAQTVVPEAVTGTHNEVDDDGNAVMQGIDQSKLVPLLTAALQEAITKIETLEAKVQVLEGS